MPQRAMGLTANFAICSPVFVSQLRALASPRQTPNDPSVGKAAHFIVGQIRQAASSSIWFAPPVCQGIAFPFDSNTACVASPTKAPNDPLETGTSDTIDAEARSQTSAAPRIRVTSNCCPSGLNRMSLTLPRSRIRGAAVTLTVRNTRVPTSTTAEASMPARRGDRGRKLAAQSGTTPPATDRNRPPNVGGAFSTPRSSRAF